MLTDHMPTLDDAFASALAAWPGISLPREALAERVGDAELESLHVNDLVLALSCARGDARALSHFERSFLTQIPQAISHVAKDASAREEVMQRLRLKLFVPSEGRAARITDYAGRGPLGGWLRVAAVREALNLVRGIKPEGEMSVDELAGPGRADDPELALVRARHGRELAEAFRETVAALPDDDRTVLRMHYVDGLEIEDVGRVFGVHRTTASRWLQKTREKVLDGTRRRVRERLRGSESEVESVLRLAQSDFDVSLNRVLS